MTTLHFQRAKRSDAGAALIELAVALPVMVVIFVGTIDFARVFYTSMALTDAARAGVQFGALNSANSVDTAGMQTAATSATNVMGMTAVATTGCQCATDAGVFLPTSPVNDCSATCSVAAGSPSQHLVVTVTVTTSKTFTTIITGFPAIPSSVSLSRTATMRVYK